MIKIDLDVLRTLLKRAKNGELEPEEVELDAVEGYVYDDEYIYCLVEVK